MNFLPQDPFEQNVIFFDVSFTCPIAGCHKEFTKGKTYRNHRVKSHGLSRYSCIVCKAPFDAHSELMKHMNQENHLVACTVCNLQFKSPGEATCHFNKKHKQFTCGDCSLIIRGETDLKAHLQFHNQERSPFNAAAFVEVAISSSFSSDLPYEIQVMQDDSRDLRGSVYFPINLDDDSNAPPDSTTQTPSTVSRAPLETVDSSTLTCSDTDTAETVSNSDTETAPSMTPCHEIEDCRSSESPLETARTKTSSFDATDFPGSSVESDPTKTSSFEAGHRRGSSVSTGEAVVFGPGASELLGGNSVDQLTLTSDSPQLLSLTNKEDDTMDWIGHNVDMYQSMSEKHKKTYRYNCSKCSCIFKNKDILRRHLNIHDSICKVCFLRFNSEGEYKKHLHEKHPKLRTFQCSVCGYSLQGLKSLMVHEMVHRLNVAFKREAEDALQLDFHHRILEFYECKFCKERIEGFSKFVRHAVWHNWESMWGTYVAGRIFKGTFTEDEANKFGKEVEDKLGTKWRDCHNRKVVSANTLHGSAAVDQTNTTDKTDSNSVAGVSNISVGASQTTALNNSHPNAANGSEICETSEDHNNEETDAKSETTEETYLSIDGWMNYWNSYLGINESSPSWVKPFIKNLGMQRKSFKADQLGCFYKQMDQISILLHAHKNGTSSLVSPTVSIEKLPTCYINSKIMRNSSVKKLKRAHCGVNNPASNAVRVDTLSTHESLKTTSNPIEESPGPASVKRARSSGPKRSGIVKNDVFQKRDNRVCHRFVKRSVSERAQVWKPPFAREGSKNESIASARSKCPSELDTCEELGDPKKTQSTCGSPSSSKECGSELMRPIVVLSKLDWIKPVIGVQKMAEPDIQVEKIIKPVIQVEKLPEAVVRVEKLREAVIRVEKLLEPAVRVEKLPEPVIQVVKMRKPVIRVEQMPEPLIRVEKIVEPVVPVEKITNAALPCNTPKPPSTSDFLQMVAWIQREIGNQKVPKWATTLIYIVCNNSQSKEQKLLKMYQIRNLIKLQFGENGTNVQMPVVKVMRLQ